MQRQMQEEKEQQTERKFIKQGSEWKDIDKQSPLPKMDDKFSDKRANIKVYKEDVKELHEEGLLNKKNIQISAEVEDLNEAAEEYKENIGKVGTIDDLDRIEDKAEDIKEKVDEANEEKLRKAKEFEGDIEIETEDLREDYKIMEEKVKEAEESGETTEITGVYKPDEVPSPGDEGKPYNFDEED